MNIVHLRSLREYIDALAGIGKLPKRSSFTGSYPLELQQRVLANWPNYRFC